MIFQKFLKIRIKIVILVIICFKVFSTNRKITKIGEKRF